MPLSVDAIMAFTYIHALTDIKTHLGIIERGNAPCTNTYPYQATEKTLL